MRMKHLMAALVAAASLSPAATPAQTAYRCGDTYSQQPCAGGKVIDAADPRSAEQRAQTDAAARRDAQAANALEKSRLDQEAQLVPARTTPVAAPAKTDPPARPVMAKPGKPAHFTAVAPRKTGEAKTREKQRKKKAASRKGAGRA